LLKYSIRTKLLASFLVTIALMVVVGIVAITRFSSVDSTTQQVQDQTVTGLTNLATVNGLIHYYRENQLLALAVGAQNVNSAQLQREFAQWEAVLNTTFRSLQADMPTARDRALLQANVDDWNTYLQAVHAARALPNPLDRQRAFRAANVDGPGARAFTKLIADSSSLNTVLTGISGRQVQHLQNTVKTGRTIVVILLIVAAIIAIALSLVLGESIARGLRQLLAAARGIAKGDVKQSVRVRRRDEIGQTADAFREMISYLDETADAARRIAAGDLAVEVTPKSDRDALGNAFVEMSAQLRDALGDRSSLEALLERMDQLSTTDLAALEAALRAVARGDLTVDAPLTTEALRAEDGLALGRLGDIFNDMHATLGGSVEAYNEMRARVAGMLRQIATETQAVAAASQQMATTSEESGRAVGEIASAVSEVAAGAERQVRTVGEARQLTEEVVTATRTSTANADETARAAEQARAVAEEGVQAIARATEGMQALEEMSAGVSDAMRSLGAKSEQIGGIVATITGIAEQTNLLALNAAIEAARAGEQGRGFAVVAEEVRKLAEESQQAAATISSLVEEIQRDTGDAVANVASSAQQIEEGSQTVRATSESFLRIGASVEDMNTRIEQIAAAIAQISESATRMESNMAEVVSVAEESSASTEQVSASTQQTSASTQQIAASAQELARTAEELERLVGQFTLA